MNVLFTGGGTAGHISPAIAVAEALEADDKVLFVGRDGGKENEAVRKCGFDVRTLKIHGLERKLSIKNFKLPFELLKSVSEAKKIIDEFKPDAIFGTGGYASLPTLLAGISRKIPTSIHESNITPGLVTKLLQKRCDRVFINLDGSREYLSKRASVKTVGIPLRKGFGADNRADARLKLGLDKNDFFILSFGGSGGAARLNESVIGVMKSFSAVKGRIKHTHAAGKKYYDGIKLENERLCRGYCGCKIVPYIDDMPSYLNAADLVISRCGANSLAEIGAVGVASILIPSPNVTDNHQYKNAAYLTERSAAIMIEEKDLTTRTLLDAVRVIESNEEQRINLGRNIHLLCKENSANIIARELKYLAKGV